MLKGIQLGHGRYQVGILTLDAHLFAHLDLARHHLGPRAAAVAIALALAVAIGTAAIAAAGPVHRDGPVVKDLVGFVVGRGSGDAQGAGEGAAEAEDGVVGRRGGVVGLEGAQFEDDGGVLQVDVEGEVGGERGVEYLEGIVKFPAPCRRRLFVSSPFHRPDCSTTAAARPMRRAGPGAPLQCCRRAGLAGQR